MSDFDSWVKKQAEPATPKTDTSKPSGGSFDSWVRGETKPKPATPATVPPQDRQEFGTRPVSLEESLTKSARLNRGRPQPVVTPDSKSGQLYEAVQDMGRRDFERKPVLQQLKERAYDAGARSGGQLSRMARQTAGVGFGIARGLNSGDFRPVDLPEWRRAEEGKLRNLEERRLKRPSSFATDVGEGIIEGSGPAAAALVLGGLTGGSLPAMAATGAGMSAAGADWSDPKRALTQTAIGAAAPLIGGKVGQTVGGAVANRLARPALQAGARAGGEVVGGAAGNVVGAGGEQLAFEGKLNPRELAKQAIIGGALNVPGAIGAARQRPASEIPAAQPVVARQPEVAPVAPRVEPARQTMEIPRVETAPAGRVPTRPQAAPIQPQPAPKPQGRAVRVGDKDYTLTPEQEARWKTEVDEPLNQANLRAADLAQRLGRQEADKMRKGVAMRIAAKKREIVGAFTEKEQAKQAAREATNYRGKPVSVDGVNGAVEGMSFGRVRVRLEDGRRITADPSQIGAPAELPNPRNTRGAIIAQPSSLPSRKLLPPGPSETATRTTAPEVSRSTAEIPRVQREVIPTQRIQYPDAPETQEMPTFRQWIAAENAPTRELSPSNETAKSYKVPEAPAAIRDPLFDQAKQAIADFGESAVDRKGIHMVLQRRLKIGYDRAVNLLEQLKADRNLTQEPTRELPQSTRMPELPPESPQVEQAKAVDLVDRKPPKATDENIDALRARYEELGREAYDRRGDFTGDLRDEYNRLNSVIREYDNERLPKELAAPPSNRPERFTPPPEERAARREALQSRTGPMPETLTPGRKVTQEVQIPPALKPTEAFSSREDARQGYFERFNDDELVSEIRRMEEIQNQAVGGRSKLTREQQEANRFDLKVAKDMQIERGRLQRQIGVDPANRIAPRTPARTFKKHPEAAPEGRQIQHSTLGLVTEAANQKGVPSGKLRVIDPAEGKESIIQNPRTKGNRQAAFVKSTGAIPAEAMPELRVKGAPPSPLEGRAMKATAGPRTDYAIPAEAMPELRGKAKPPDIVQKMARLTRTPSSPVEISKLRAEFPQMSKADFDAQMTKLNEEGRIALHRHDHPASLSEGERANLVKIGKDYFTAATFRERPGEIMGFGLGSLQSLFGRKTPPTGQQSLFPQAKTRLSRSQASETVGGLQTVAQLGNPRFVIRNILQHVAFGKQERAATRLAAVIDWGYSKVSGSPRQIAAPKGSDLASYVRNWSKAIKAHKAGQALPGGSSPIAPTANANAIDKSVQKLMTWMNEIPDAANWQTRFEGSLQSIVDASKRSRSPLNMAEAIEQATMEANKASLRDKNFASKTLVKMKKALNVASSPVFGTDKFGVGDFVLKYAQTPGALLKRGLERSPLGLFEVAKQAATPGPFRRRNTLLALSRVIEGGVAGAGLGAGLAAAGVLVGPDEESKTGKAMEREEGVRGYSLNASALGRLLMGDSTEMKEGDQLYSIDWLQPWAMNLSAGAAVYGLHKNGKLGGVSGAKATGEAVYNSLAKTLDIMGDQSILKNLSRYVSRASGETFADQILSFTKAIGLDVPSSFVPSLARQTRQVIDPYERDTRPEERGGFAGFMKEATGRALAQIPGISESFPKRPSLLTGEDRKTALGEMSVPGRVLAQVSPANVSTFTPRPVAQEISRLSKAGYDVSIAFPKSATDKKTKTVEPTSSLRSREREFARNFSKLSQELIKDLFYKDADDEMKAEAFNGLKRYLRTFGKEDFEEKGVDEIIEAAIETVEKRRDKDE